MTTGTDSETTLLPCPSCGAAAKFSTESQSEIPFKIRAWIKCPQCRQSQVYSDWYNGDLGTMEASWNTRQ